MDKDFEWLSVLADGEVSDEALDKLLASEEAQQKWREYHVAKDYMQGVVGREIQFSADFSVQLAAIGKEHKAAQVAPEKWGEAKVAPVQHTHKSAANQTFFKGFAVAASVLALAVTTWQFWPHTDASVAAVAVSNPVPAVNNDDIVSVGSKAALAAPHAMNTVAQKDVVMPQAALQNHPDATTQNTVHVEKNAVASEVPASSVQ